jgi:hypothetical protein
MIDATQKYITQVKFSPNNIISYQLYVGDRRRQSDTRSMDNLKLSKEKKDVSRKAQQRLMRAMDWLLLIAQEKSAINMKSNKLFKYKLSLVTLTLPAAQFHNDNYIKKFLLNGFLQILRKDYNLQNYLWKAEKQHNGNIHFHIVIDKYVYFRDLNRIWNKILDNHGYIEKYRAAQLAHHKEGFTPRPELFDYWSKDAQYKAYKEGWLTNWSNPSASSDIHSLKKIRNAKAYLAKYLTKNPDANRAVNFECKKYKKENACTIVPYEVLQQIRDTIRNKLHVSGNLWYISRSLSKLKGVTSDLSDAIRAELEFMRSKFNDKVLDLDTCTVYKFNIHELLKHKFLSCFEQLKNYCLSMRELFYPPGTQEKYVLGIPLPIFDNYGN